MKNKRRFCCQQNISLHKMYHGIARAVATAVANFSFLLNPSDRRMGDQFHFSCQFVCDSWTFSRIVFCVQIQIKWASSEYPKIPAILLIFNFSLSEPICALILIFLPKNNGNKLYGDNNFLFGNCSKAISFKGSNFFLIEYVRDDDTVGALVCLFFDLVGSHYFGKSNCIQLVFCAGVKRMTRIGLFLFLSLFTSVQRCA